MRIAAPVADGKIAVSLGDCEAIRFYEDDHGKIIRQSVQKPERAGFDAVLALLERGGADVLLCAPLPPEERGALAAAGLLFASDASGDADAAVQAYLGRAIACDPSNTCNYCGFRDTCKIERKE